MQIRTAYACSDAGRIINKKMLVHETNVTAFRPISPPPTPIEPGDAYMLVPHNLNPPYHPLFRTLSGNLPETTAKNTPSPEKMGIRMRPLMHSSGGGGGGGGAGLSKSEEFLLGEILVNEYLMH